MPLDVKDIAALKNRANRAKAMCATKQWQDFCQFLAEKYALNLAAPQGQEDVFLVSKRISPRWWRMPSVGLSTQRWNIKWPCSRPVRRQNCFLMRYQTLTLYRGIQDEEKISFLVT
jgi:hypothetical protein